MSPDELDRVIVEWTREGPDHGRRHALERALAATRRIDQRAGWTFPRRWLPKPVAELDARVPRQVILGTLLVLLIIALIASTLVLTGSPPRIRSLLGPSAHALVAYQDGASVYVSAIDGSGRRLLTSDVPYSRSPVFSPDGMHVAFIAPGTPEELGGRLLLLPVDGSVPAIDLSGGREVVAGEVPSVAWSPDGQRIAFAAPVDGVATIFVAASDGSDVMAITDQTADRVLPVWSPDGEWIAIRETHPDGFPHLLLRIRPDGTETQTITTMPAPDSSLSMLQWSPVSESMSYTVNYGHGTSTTAFIDLGFGHMVELWSDGMGGFADHGTRWSPDGRYLAFITATEGVVVADDRPSTLDEGALRRLGPVADCWVDWSPDGTALYGGSPGGCDGVTVIPLADPSAVTTLPRSGPGMASWQPQTP